MREFLPEAQLSQANLEFTATSLNQRLIQNITVSNLIPETLLEGKWEVAPHPNDPAHTPDSHAWISLEPAKFASNSTKCSITVDTSKLRSDEYGERTILLHTNSSPNPHSLTLKVQTASLQIENKKLPYISLALLCGFSFGSTWLIFKGWDLVSVGLAAASTGKAGAGSPELWAAFGAGLFFGPYILGLELLLLVLILLASGIMNYSIDYIMAIVGYFLSTLAGASITWGRKYWISFFESAGDIFSSIVENFTIEGFSTVFTGVILLLTIGLGISSGMRFIVGFLEPPIMLAIGGTGLTLSTMILYPPLNRARLSTPISKKRTTLN
ncbi:hypothetical protein [Coleofasciculus sp. H7-2]|uniref:hypothetical protein n=1 Tax=Coleofasciculus sp. H7-2 TaxID=3351545 RepID=UPI00367029DA